MSNSPREASGPDGGTTLSFVIPVFNEEPNVEDAYRQLCDVATELDRYQCEFVFTDNHSDDRTFEILQQIAARDRRVRAVRFVRNYGFQRSLLTAYRMAAGDAAIQIDCDLQDPPSLIPQFVKRWEEGHDVVVGVRRRRKEGVFLTMCRRAFYALLERISEERVTQNAGDFRLIDRSIIVRLQELQDLHPYVRGLVDSMATNEAVIEYDRQERSRGRSKFPFLSLVAFAVDGIISHSVFPLRVATMIGLTLAVVASGLSIFYLGTALLFGRDWPPGFATTTILLLLGMSLNAIFMGVLGEYVSRIYQQVRQRPLTLIEKAVNVGVSPGSAAQGADKRPR